MYSCKNLESNLPICDKDVSANLRNFDINRHQTAMHSETHYNNLNDQNYG